MFSVPRQKDKWTGYGQVTVIPATSLMFLLFGGCRRLKTLSFFFERYLGRAQSNLPGRASLLQNMKIGLECDIFLLAKSGEFH
jgi:hypothetical protein